MYVCPEHKTARCTVLTDYLKAPYIGFCVLSLISIFVFFPQIWSTMNYLLGALAVSTALACQRELMLNVQPNFDFLTPKRQRSSIASPDQNEAVLLGSFDNVTLEEWSYYYTHGLHLAGTNESQAQWTADRFAQFGWIAPELAQYCMVIIRRGSHSANSHRCVPKLPCVSLFDYDHCQWNKCHLPTRGSGT